MFMLIIKERDFNSWKRSTQGLGEHSLTAEKIYWINFSATKRRFCLSLHYNAANSYLFVNGVEIIKFKAKVKTDPLLGVIIDPLCLGNLLKDFFNKWNEKKQNYMEVFMILVLIITIFQSWILKIFISIW